LRNVDWYQILQTNKQYENLYQLALHFFELVVARFVLEVDFCTLVVEGFFVVDVTTLLDVVTGFLVLVTVGFCVLVDVNFLTLVVTGFAVLVVVGFLELDVVVFLVLDVVGLVLDVITFLVVVTTGL
jgi:hypothetical protein